MLNVVRFHLRLHGGGPPDPDVPATPDLFERTGLAAQLALAEHGRAEDGSRASEDTLLNPGASAIAKRRVLLTFRHVHVGSLHFNS